MKNFRRFMAVPVLALCTLLTFSACSNDDTEGGGTPVTGDLLKFEVINLSEFSLDVKVDKAEACDKYVVTVVSQTVAEEVGFETNFISSSQSSINPTKDQLIDGTQSYKVFSASATIPESQLSKGTKYDSDICEGLALARTDITDTSLDPAPIKYVVAAYGIDKFGNERVYIGEPFVLPKAVYGAEPIVEITPITSLTKITADFKAPANCVKIVYGSLHTIVNDYGGISDPDFWLDSNKENIIAHLQKQPLAYSPIPNGTKVLDNRREMKVIGKPGEKLVVYAYGITADGQIGPISYAIGTLQMPTNPGLSTVQKLTKRTSNFELKLFWDVVYSPNTTAVRFMMTTKDKFNEYFSGTPQKEMEFLWTMTTNESPDGYGWWEEFTTDELRQMNYVYSPDVNWYNTEYVIYAIARDGSGRWGQIFQGESQTTMKNPNVDPTIDFSLGTGVATINILSMVDDPDDSASCNATYKVTKGANTKQAYLFRFSENDNFTSYESFTFDAVQAEIRKKADIYTIIDHPLVTFDQEYKAGGGSFYKPSNWGTAFHVIVTEDMDGKFAIAGIIAAGKETPITF